MDWRVQIMAYTGKRLLISAAILSLIAGTIACGSPAIEEPTSSNSIETTASAVISTPTSVPATPTSIPATPTPDPTDIPIPTPTPIVVTVETAPIEAEPEVVQPTATTVIPESTPLDDSPEEPSITSPLAGVTGEALAPLQDNLIYLIYFDSRTKSWSVYDNAGTFTLEDLTPILMGAMPDSVSPITTIDANQPAYVKISTDTSFMGRDLTAGYNLIVWKP